ncbi:hypothetical protein AAHI06_21900 [Pseudomonas salmasensis]|uniref:hypothetical protein n=1 Tax=Pseudomonas salmasensis TaxID=2745514 RepID=UPI00321C21B2
MSGKRDSSLTSKVCATIAVAPHNPGYPNDFSSEYAHSLGPDILAGMRFGPNQRYLLLYFHLPDDLQLRTYEIGNPPHLKVDLSVPAPWGEYTHHAHSGTLSVTQLANQQIYATFNFETEIKTPDETLTFSFTAGIISLEYYPTPPPYRLGNRAFGQ